MIIDIDKTIVDEATKVGHLKKLIDTISKKVRLVFKSGKRCDDE